MHPYEWMVSHVLVLLEQLSLQQYIQVFAEARFNGISIKSGYIRDVGELLGVAGPHVFKIKQAFDVALQTFESKLGMYSIQLIGT